VTLPPLFTFLFLFFVLSIFFLLTFVHDKIVVGDGWGRGVSRFGGLSPTGLSLLPLALPLQMLYLSDQRHVLQFFFWVTHPSSPWGILIYFLKMPKKLLSKKMYPHIPNPCYWWLDVAEVRHQHAMTCRMNEVIEPSVEVRGMEWPFWYSMNENDPWLKVWGQKILFLQYWETSTNYLRTYFDSAHLSWQIQSDNQYRGVLPPFLFIHSYFFWNYTIYRRHSQRTHTHPYEYTHANPTPRSSFEDCAGKSSR
jgi:hypothetical protein